MNQTKTALYKSLNKFDEFSLNKIKNISLYTGIYLILAFTVIISVGPLIWVIMSSFKTNAQIVGSPFSLPTSINFNAYIEVFQRDNFLMFAYNSFLYATVATAISLVIYAMGAYVFAKHRFPFRNMLFALFALTMLVPAHSRTQPLFSMLLALNLFNTRAGIILIYITGGMAISLFILRSAFSSVPYELTEAALIEGAGFFRNFFQINLPLAKGGLATAGILMWLGNWNEFYFASILTASADTRTLPFALAFFNEMFSINYTRMFAALTIVIVPGIVIYALTQEQVQVSIASTGVKG